MPEKVYLEDARESWQRLSKEKEEGDDQGAEDCPLDCEPWSSDYSIFSKIFLHN